jgi:hypothetical protein
MRIFRNAHLLEARFLTNAKRKFATCAAPGRR